MIALEKLKARLIADEGKVRHAYTDSEGWITIGVGRLVDQRRGGGLSDDEIDYLLMNDIRKAEALARTYPWYESLDWPRQAVIVCMLFQLGLVGLNGFKKMREALERQDYATAAIEMLNSRWQQQTSARAKRMADVMRTGVWLE